MNAVCHSCGTLLRDEDINVELNAARCSLCSALTDLSVPQDAPTPPAPAIAEQPFTEPAEVRAKVPLPDGIRVEESGTDLLITRRWFSSQFLFLILFCIFWDGFLVFWYSKALSPGRNGQLNLVMLLFPLGHAAVGIGLTYYTIAGILNRSIVRVADGMLLIHHEPLPWPGRRSVPVGDIEQIYCTERISHGKHGTTVRYTVSAVLNDGRKLKLLAGLADPDQARYIEQTLEDHIGIADAPVGGEMAR